MFNFDRNIDHKYRPSLTNCLFFLSNIAKNALFAFCYDISIAEVRLRFNLERKFRSVIAEVALLQKKINNAFCAALLM